MLHLKRIVHPFDFMYDSTGDIMMYGDFYYEDDEDTDSHGHPYRIRATTYQNLKNQRKRDNWDYTILNRAETLRDYEKQVREAEHELFKESVLSRKVWGKDSQNNDRDAGDY